MRPYSTLPNRYSTTTIFPTTTQPLSNPDNHREPQPIHNRPSTACRTRTCKALLQPSNNHAPTILRVESKNDSDTTIPYSRFFNLGNVELHGLGLSINCLGRRVTSFTTRDAKEIAKLSAMVP